MIEFKQVSKLYHTADRQTVGLRDIDWHIPRGTIAGIIGKSGAGKSTLIRCINLLEHPTQGQVIVDGVEMTSLDTSALRRQRRRIGMIFQHFNLLHAKTVFDNVALPLKLQGLDHHTISQKVMPLLTLTSLEDKTHVYPAQLSGGQKQRVAIARALVNDPHVLLCDEATSALDPHTTEQILKLLRRINQVMQLTIVLVTHEMDVIKKMSDHVAVLDHGRIVDQGDIFHLFTQSKHPITRQLVDYTLKLDLPEAIEDVLHQQPSAEHAPLIRFTFVGSNSTEPFLSEMTRSHQVDFNILQAHIDMIQGKAVGFMLAQALANKAQLEAVLAHAKSQGLHAEVIGYVA